VQEAQGDRMLMFFLFLQSKWGAYLLGAYGIVGCLSSSKVVMLLCSAALWNIQ
jgi:hypothetical protein